MTTRNRHSSDASPSAGIEGIEGIAGIEALGLPDATREVLVRWLTDDRFASEREALEQLVGRAVGGDGDARAELEDAFSGPLPIGTGGRRGKCGPGPNRVNAVVLRETAHGLVLALKDADFWPEPGPRPGVAIAFDTRRDSAAFAQLVGAQLAAGGCEVVLLDAPRPTPQLSFFMRARGCAAGIVISASHNPPGDNGIKIYGPDGAQVLAESDRALMRGIVAAGESPVPELDLDAAAGVEAIDPATGSDAAYHAYVLAQGTSGAGDGLADSGLKVVFTPLHGVGHTSVVPVLRARGVSVSTVERQCDPDGGRFSTVESANPEVAASMQMAIEQARTEGADLVLASDPDADRLGACVPAAKDPAGDWHPIDGNRLGVLMLDHVLRTASLPARGWVLTTMVSSPLIATLARAHDVDVVDDLLVGFKHHAGMVREQPDRPVIFACEESHGYLRGNEIRDKDGAIAALLLTECAAACKREGKDLLARLDAIWAEHGYHRERTENLWAHGQTGREAIAAVMAAWRAEPPTAFGGLSVRAMVDKRAPDRARTGSPTRDLEGNVLSFELAAGEIACRLVLRPSGTEPKLKLYALARARPGGDLEAAKREVDAMVGKVLADAKARARRVMEPLMPSSNEDADGGAR